LADRKPADFAHYFVSKIEKNAINYGKHYYQVDVMTPANYAAYLKQEAANPSPKREIRYYRQ
jgi:bla regulator protein blaR1